jgi:Domain of unknown function (DUF5679)
MLKRIFWLALIGVGCWLLYRLWQQRQEDFGGTPPLLAPLEPYGRHIPPPGPVASPPAASSAPPPAAAVSPAPPETAPAAAPTDAGDAEAITGYCARCKARRTISDPHEETTESGRRAARGTCPVCGAKMFTFLPNKS